jgi:hypothetical protein
MMMAGRKCKSGQHMHATWHALICLIDACSLLMPQAPLHTAHTSPVVFPKPS